MRPLTDLERDVARLVADGLSDKEIGRDLGIGQQRVNQIVHQIARKWRLDAARNLRVQIARRFADAA